MQKLASGKQRMIHALGSILKKPVFVVFAVLLTLISCNGPDKNASSKEPATSQTETPSRLIIEVIADTTTSLDPDQLITVCKQQGIINPDIYQWKNHWVIYDTVTEPENLRKQITEKFPASVVKVYDNLFYEFNRKQCSDTTTANEWEHILLTANLVKDPVWQQEYLDHHATQYQNWPEVSKGFCQARFQQLLLFKNERQLMLVISIPKGASLDELNPKTAENNPRVNDWNNLMKKYQEGIPGTAPGEVWVFLKPVTTTIHTKH